MYLSIEKKKTIVFCLKIRNNIVCKCKGTCYLVPHFVVCCLYLFSGKLFMFIFGKKAHEANDVLRRGQKIQLKTKRLKQIQIYISIIHAIKHYKTLVF